MRKISVSIRESQVLDALCELGETDLVARKLNISMRTVERHINTMMARNKYPNRLTIVLAWDRMRRGHES